MAIDKTPREASSREFQQRKPFRPQGSFPQDIESPGWRFRWVRTHYNGSDVDNQNVYKRRTAGWEPVSSDAPEVAHLQYLADGGQIKLGGTVLCKNSEESVQEQVDYYAAMARGQEEGAVSQFVGGDKDKFYEQPRTRVIKGRQPTSADL